MATYANGCMDEWEREANGSAPSFQEFLATEHTERHKLVDAFIARRGLAAADVDRASLEAFLEHGGGALASDPAQAERVLDALLRVRAERLLRKPGRDRSDRSL